MTVRVMLFGPLRDVAGWAEGSVAGDSAEEVWRTVCDDCPELQRHRAGVRPAIDLVYAGWDDPLRDGAVLAFIPPVAGGAADAVLVAASLSREPIDVAALLQQARRDAAGALDMFVGTVRDHSDGLAVSRLDYEAYEPMAERMLLELAERTAAVTGVQSLLAIHRLGELAVGDVAIAVVAAAAHRRAAFAACRMLVDAIKAEVPIFKREHTAHAVRWVNACEPAVAR